MNNTTFKRYVDAIVSGTIPRFGSVAKEVAIEPANPDAPLAPVVEVVLRPARERHPDDYDGSACSSSCGYCGRCTDGINTNCLCADCGLAFWRGPEDCDNFCDGCRAQRDAHTTALELRMAKAHVDGAVKKGAA